jgi:hypothetical protein
MGGILFTLLQLLYLPNLALAGISYLFGTGFSLGLGTSISPTNLDLNSLPAIPILGALPTNEHPLFLIALIAPVLMILINQIAICRSYQTLTSRQFELIKVLIPQLALLMVLSYFAGGTLLTQDMNPVGIRWWNLPIVFALIQLIALTFGLYLPKLIKKIKAHKSEL